MNKGIKFALSVAGVAIAAKIAAEVMKRGMGYDEEAEYNYDPQTGEALRKENRYDPQTGEVLFKDYKYDPQTGEPLN